MLFNIRPRVRSLSKTGWVGVKRARTVLEFLTGHTIRGNISIQSVHKVPFVKFPTHEEVTQVLTEHHDFFFPSRLGRRELVLAEMEFPCQ